MMTQSLIRRVCVVGVIAGIMLSGASPARAEGLLTGFLGTNFGGDADSGTGSFGFALGATAGGVFGFEFDLATTTDMFGDSALVDDSAVTTAMGNLLVGVGGPVRPYVSGGVGLIRSRVDATSVATTETNDFGVNLGIGVMAFFSDHVGIRGDVRYFRVAGSDGDDELLDLDFELGELDFWRGSAGLTLRW